MMSIIYRPKGAAREYSPLALNIYLGCSHRCEYCYAPGCLRKTQDEYFGKPSPRKNIAELLEKELKKNAPKEQVMLSFVGDPYCDTTDDNQATRDVLELLLKYRVPTAILTKGGARCLQDLDLIRRFGPNIRVGASLTAGGTTWRDYEPGAASWYARVAMLATLKVGGVETFASFEPLLPWTHTQEELETSLAYCDSVSVGALTKYKIDGWERYLEDGNYADDVVRFIAFAKRCGKKIYVKKSCQKMLPPNTFEDEEIDMDSSTLKGWKE